MESYTGSGLYHNAPEAEELKSRLSRRSNVCSSSYLPSKRRFLRRYQYLRPSSRELEGGDATTTFVIRSEVYSEITLTVQAPLSALIVSLCSQHAGTQAHTCTICIHTRVHVHMHVYTHMHVPHMHTTISFSGSCSKSLAHLFFPYSRLL